MCCARRIAASSFIIGQKSVEMVIAYILLALYPIAVKRYEDDRSWIFLGMAIRYAVFNPTLYNILIILEFPLGWLWTLTSTSEAQLNPKTPYMRENY